MNKTVAGCDAGVGPALPLEEGKLVAVLTVEIISAGRGLIRTVAEAVAAVTKSLESNDRRRQGRADITHTNTRQNPPVENKWTSVDSTSQVF